MTSHSQLRSRWLGAFAMATATEIDGIVGRCGIDLGRFEVLRAPEVGLVMAQARAGGTGAPFNLGEVTVTRCAVRASKGQVGIGWVQGRRPGHALRVACLDAAFQDVAANQVEPLLEELAAALAARRAVIARKAAATKVEFFTLVRGED